MSAKQTIPEIQLLGICKSRQILPDNRLQRLSRKRLHSLLRAVQVERGLLENEVFGLCGEPCRCQIKAPNATAVSQYEQLRAYCYRIKAERASKNPEPRDSSRNSRRSPFRRPL